MCTIKIVYDSSLVKWLNEFLHSNRLVGRLRTTRTANDAAATMVANKQLWQPQMCTLEEITTTPFSIMSYKHKPSLPPPVNFLKISDKSYFDGKTKTKHTDAKFGCFWPKYDHNFTFLNHKTNFIWIRIGISHRAQFYSFSQALLELLLYLIFDP